jgi:hypothetical protein
MRWAEHVSNLKYEIRARNFVREPGGKRTFWRPSHRWNGNIKMYLRERVVIDAILLAYGRV